MFGFGAWEWAIILIIALIVLGPKKLPELAKSLGKGIREFRSASRDFRSTIEDEVNRPEELGPPAEEYATKASTRKATSMDEAYDADNAKTDADEASSETVPASKV